MDILKNNKALYDTILPTHMIKIKSFDKLRDSIIIDDMVAKNISTKKDLTKEEIFDMLVSNLIPALTKYSETSYIRVPQVLKSVFLKENNHELISDNINEHIGHIIDLYGNNDNDTLTTNLAYVCSMAYDIIYYFVDLYYRHFKNVIRDGCASILYNFGDLIDSNSGKDIRDQDYYYIIPQITLKDLKGGNNQKGHLNYDSNLAYLYTTLPIYNRRGGFKFVKMSNLTYYKVRRLYDKQTFLIEEFLPRLFFLTDIIKIPNLQYIDRIASRYTVVIKKYMYELSKYNTDPSDNHTLSHSFYNKLVSNLNYVNNVKEYGSLDPNYNKDDFIKKLQYDKFNSDEDKIQYFVINYMKTVLKEPILKALDIIVNHKGKDPMLIDETLRHLVVV